MRRVILLGAVLLAALAPVPAGAATGQDDATLSVTVNDTVTVTFTDDTAAFGSHNAGTGVVEQLDTLAYTVSSNVAAGFTLDVSVLNAASSGEPQFAIRRGTDSGAYTVIPAAPGLVFDNWVTESAAGTFNYTDDARVLVDANAAGGTFTRTLRYLATTN